MDIGNTDTPITISIRRIKSEQFPISQPTSCKKPNLRSDKSMHNFIIAFKYREFQSLSLPNSHNYIELYL